MIFPYNLNIVVDKHDGWLIVHSLVSEAHPRPEHDKKPGIFPEFTLETCIRFPTRFLIMFFTSFLGHSPRKPVILHSD
jgi:hypothetical protein